MSGRIVRPRYETSKKNWTSAQVFAAQVLVSNEVMAVSIAVVLPSERVVDSRELRDEDRMLAVQSISERAESAALMPSLPRRLSQAGVERFEQRGVLVVIAEFPDHHAAELLVAHVLGFAAERLRVVVGDEQAALRVEQPRH